MPKNREELVRFMVEEWNSISDRTLINLVGSMKRICELVIESNGKKVGLIRFRFNLSQ